MFRIWHKSLSLQFLPFWQIYSHKIGSTEWNRDQGKARHHSNNNETNTAHIKFRWMNLFGIMAYLQYYIWWKNSQFELVNLWQWWSDVEHWTDWTIKVYTKMFVCDRFDELLYNGRFSCPFRFSDHMLGKIVYGVYRDSKWCCIVGSLK